MNLLKITLKVILAISLLINSAGQGYLSRAQSRDALRPMAFRNHYLVEKVRLAEYRPHPNLNLSQEKNILVYGGLGDLQTYMGLGFKELEEVFPNVRFIVADVKKPETEGELIRQRMEEIGLPWRRDNNYFVAPEDYPAEDWLLQDKAGNSLPIDDKGVISLKDGQEIKIDAVVVAVPTYLHLPITQLWAEKGVPVWVEKPIVMPNEEEMETIWRLTSKKASLDKIFAVDFCKDSDVLTWLLKESNLLDKIGNLKSIRGRGVEAWPLNPGIRRWLWQPGKSGGGLGIDMALHPLLMMAAVLEKKDIHPAYAGVRDLFLGRYEEAPGADEVETYFWMHANVADIDLYVDSGNAVDTTYTGITIVGERAEIEVFIGTGEYPAYIRYKDTAKPEATDVIYLFEGSRFAYTNTFAEFLSLVYGRPDINDLAKRRNLAITTLEIVRRAYKFAETHRISPVTHKAGRLPEGVSKLSLGEVFPGLPKTGQAIFAATASRYSSAGSKDHKQADKVSFQQVSTDPLAALSYKKAQRLAGVLRDIIDEVEFDELNKRVHSSQYGIEVFPADTAFIRWIRQQLRDGGEPADVDI